MELDQLLHTRGDLAVDEIVGQIVGVDFIRLQPSRFGKDQRVQDITLQDPNRRRFVIAMYDLRRNCFSDQNRRGWDAVDFDKMHEGLWVRFRNTSKDSKKPSLRKLSNHSTTAKHYTKKGIGVVLKATSSTSITWLLERGQSSPPLHPSDKIKRPRPLKVPGQNNDHEPRRTTTKERETMALPPEEYAQRMVTIAMQTVRLIKAAYERKEGMTVPKDDELRSVLSTILIALKKKLNLEREDLDYIKKCSWGLACLFVTTHQEVVNQSGDLIPTEQCRTIAITIFIEVSANFTPPKRQDQRSDDRRDGRDDDRRRDRDRR